MDIWKHPKWSWGEYIPADDTFPAALHIGFILIIF